MGCVTQHWNCYYGVYYILLIGEDPALNQLALSYLRPYFMLKHLFTCPVGFSRCGIRVQNCLGQEIAGLDRIDLCKDSGMVTYSHVPNRRLEKN